MTISAKQRTDLRSTCDGLLGRLDSLTDAAVTAGFAAAPGIALSGPRFTDAAVREHNLDPVHLFLLMARDLTTEVGSGRPEELQHNARAWAAEGMRRGVITPHQVVRFSASAHAVCLRAVINALPNHTLPTLLAPVAEWHAEFYNHTNAQAESILRSVPGFPLQREGDQWRNWVLELALLDGAGSNTLDLDAPPLSGVLVLRTTKAEVAAILARTTRPPWWWTVHRAAADTIMIVVDRAESPATWAEETLDCVAPANGAEGSVACHEGARDTLATTARLVLELARSAPPGPVVRTRMMKGTHVRIAQALVAHGVDDDLARLTRSIGGGPDLLETVTAFLRCDLRTAKAAELLGIHRSTLEYRLTRIAQQSGIDPRTTSGAALWWTALVVGRSARS